MKKFTILTLTLALILSASSFESLAASEAPQSTFSNEINSSALIDHAYLSLLSTFHGPSTSSFDSKTVDANGTHSARAINFENELTAAYLLNQDLGIGIVLPFNYSPVLGQNLSQGDLGAKFFDRHAVTASGLNIYANAIVQATTSNYSRNRGQDLALKTTPNVRYQLPHSRITLGSWTEAKAYLGVTRDKAFKLYAEPYAMYQLSNSLSLSVAYEMEWDHMVGQPGLLNFMTYQTDLQPGFVYMIAPKISLNPYLQIFTTQQASKDKMAIGAVLSASVL